MAENPIIVRARVRDWQRANPARVREASARYRRAHPDKLRAKKLMEKYGLTQAEYDQMLADQGGVCAICKKPETKVDPRLNTLRRLAVDHDHATGKNRGLLCFACNTSIGLLKESPELLAAALLYLAQQGV